MPMLGLGTVGIPSSRVGGCVKRALDEGVRLIDASPSSEGEVGAVLHHALCGGGLKRGEVWVTARLLPRGLEGVRPALLQSLRKLRLDFVDLYLLDCSSAEASLPLLWEEMEVCVRDGLATTVIECEPGFRNEEILAFCDASGVHVSVSSPVVCSPAGGGDRLSSESMIARRLQQDCSIITSSVTPHCFGSRERMGAK
ncbi:MAG: hypothetical protein SGPRY_012161 [Prymnesium sp.]